MITSVLLLTLVILAIAIVTYSWYSAIDNLWIALIDCSGSMTYPMIMKALDLAIRMGIRKGAYFNNSVSDLMDIKELKKEIEKKFKRGGDNCTDFDKIIPWAIIKAPDSLLHVFTDGEFYEDIRSLPFTIHIISFMGQNE